MRQTSHCRRITSVSNRFLLFLWQIALMVGPVNMIPEMVKKSCPRVLLNNELAGTFLTRNGPRTRRMIYDNNVQRDIFHKGDCDASIITLCKILGWENELLELNSSTRLPGEEPVSSVPWSTPVLISTILTHPQPWARRPAYILLVISWSSGTTSHGVLPS